MQRMGWTLPHTIGNLHLLWYWALEYAPTGNLTKFDFDQLTCDPDLGDATPEQFLEAMIQAGFIDRSEDGQIRIHDWPDYTAKCLRPKFRRHPERWHQVLRSYGIPVVTRQRSSISNSTRNSAPAPERPTSSCAEREPKMVEHGPQGAVRVDCAEGAARKGEGSGSDWSQMDFQAVPKEIPSAKAESEYAAAALRADDHNISQNNNVAQPVQQTEPETTSAPALDLPTEQQRANLRRIRGEMPRALSLVPGFADTWWLRLLEMYKNRGTPLDPNQRRELLARLCMRPNSSVKLLKHCVENSLDCKWEHLPNTS